MKRACGLAMTLLVGCGEGRIDWFFDASAVDSANRIETRILRGSCTSDDAVYEAAFARDGTPPDPPSLANGVYGFEVVALDDECQVIGEGCSVATLPQAAVTVVVEPSTPPRPRCSAAMCVAGRCVDEPDAGVPPGDGSIGCDCEEATDQCVAGTCVPLVRALEVHMGNNFGCALGEISGTGARQVYCWGVGSIGRLGAGCEATSAAPVSVPLPGGEMWQELEVGNHTCALSASGRLFCWGQNNTGQVGPPPASCSGNYASPFEIVVTDVSWIDVAVTDQATCAIDADGGRYCWGRLDQGRSGDGTTNHANSNVPIAFDDPALVSDASFSWASIEGGANGNFYGRNPDGAVYIFGWNDAGQTLPTGASTTRATRLGLGIETWDLGRGYGCQVDTGGRLRCWGCSATRALTNYTGCQLGALGLGDTFLDPEPLTGYQGTFDRLEVATDATSVGAYNHTCAIVGGRLSCWGPYGILGIGALPAACSERAGTPYCSTPQPVDSAFDDWAQVSVGASQSCAIRDGGRLYCWGWPAGPDAGAIVETPSRLHLN